MWAMDYATSMGMPVAIIQHNAAANDSPTFREGSKEWKLHPEIGLKKRDILKGKRQPGNFTGTGREQWLREAGVVGRVVICNYMRRCTAIRPRAKLFIWIFRWTSAATQ